MKNFVNAEKVDRRIDRRTLIAGVTGGLLVSAYQQAFADALMNTPALTEGPYYPDKLPLDRDNDLIIINKSLTPAVGVISHLTGRVLDPRGNPIKGATDEIWQCDAKQVYLNSRDSVPKASQRDINFQGFGQFETASTGEYRFRTIKPVPYPGRSAPHIHVKVKKGGTELLTTQVMIRGFSGNKTDNVYGGISDPIDRELVLTDFVPIKGRKTGELSAKFDIVIGRTLSDEQLAERAIPTHLRNSRRWI